MTELGLETITGRNFADQEVRIDGREFVSCTFRNCRFIYGGGPPFILSGNEIQGCHFEFVGAAQNTLNALRGLHHYGLGEVVEVVVASIRKPLAEDATPAL